MKKLKSSWILLLAVLFAVGSAFTTTRHEANSLSSKVVELWYANDARNAGNPLTSSQVNASLSFTDSDLTPSFLSTHCPPASIICLAKFQQGPSGSQIAYKLGRYQ